MYTFTSEMTIRPEHLAEFETALSTVMGKAAAEPACEFIFANRSAEDPCVFLMFERWTSKEAFVDEVMKRGYYLEYKTATASFHREPRVVRVWTNASADQSSDS